MFRSRGQCRHLTRMGAFIGLTIFIAMFQQNASAQQDRDTLRILFWQAPTQLNPHLSGGFKDLNAARISYEPLATFDNAGNLIPCLAAEIPTLENGGVAPDGKSVTWKLKAGVKWSDGQPFTADDVLFTYQLATNPEVKAVTAQTYSNIAQIEVHDDVTLTLHFKTVTPDWATMFVGRNGMIVPRHVFEAYNNANVLDAPANLKPVGTGPYRAVEYKTEDMLIIGEDVVNTIKITYEANPFYRESGKPFFRRLELRGGGDALTAANAVLTMGSVDFAWNLQIAPSELQNIPQTNGQLLFAPGTLLEWILINHTDPNRATDTGERSSIQFPHPFFREKKVRQAFAHAIDRAAIAALYGETARPMANILFTPTKYASPNTANLYPFDLARAAALLDEAGWRDTDNDGVRDNDGVKLRVLFQTTVNPLRQQNQQIIKTALESIGVEVELKAIDASVFFSNDPNNTNSAVHFYADLEEFSVANPSPDPSRQMGGPLCKWIVQQANNWRGSNVPRWCNPTYDDIFTRSAVELDPDKRAQLFIQMNDLLVEEVAMIPLVNLMEINAASHLLSGIQFSAWDAATWQIVEWRRKE